MGFRPFEKKLYCPIQCPTDDVQWNLTSLSDGEVEATFRSGRDAVKFSQTFDFSLVNVTEDGALHILQVNTEPFRALYVCTAFYSNGSVCNTTDFQLEVFELCK